MGGHREVEYGVDVGGKEVRLAMELDMASNGYFRWCSRAGWLLMPRCTEDQVGSKFAPHFGQISYCR